jgi:hypothetical protein
VVIAIAIAQSLRVFRHVDTPVGFNLGHRSVRALHGDDSQISLHNFIGFWFNSERYSILRLQSYDISVIYASISPIIKKVRAGSFPPQPFL